MNIILDACSVINLCNAASIDSICRLEGHRFWIGPIVLGECNEATAAIVFRLIEEGHLLRLDESRLSGERFLELLADFQLGDGETECIAAAETLDLMVCTDDGAARRAVIQVLGEDRLIGSVGLLRRCVESDIIDCGGATSRLESMRQMGGYLPLVEAGYFCVR